MFLSGRCKRKLRESPNKKYRNMFNCLDFVCDYCSRTFTRKYNLQTHIENCHISCSCSCDICGQTFGSPAGLQLHLSRGHNRYSQPYPECDICGRIFTRKQNINSHMVTVHLQGVGPKIRCELCLKAFTTERNLKRHMNQLHNPNVQYPTCDECCRVFKTKSALISHIQCIHRLPEKDVIKCHLCHKVYTSTRNLKRHVEMHHGEPEEFKCDICPKVYTSNQSLRRHTKTAHYTENLDENQCEVCSVKIIGKENLEAHVQFYHQESSSSNDNSVESKFKAIQYVCETCNNCFVEEPDLRQHIKQKHSFDVFYEYCKKSLQKQYGSNTTSCSKQSFYQCEFCSKSFSSMEELKDHMKINHNREYCLTSCNVCFNKFYSKEIMLEHKKICKTPPNAHSCGLCDKLFTDISSLEFHKRIFHPQVEIADSNISSTKEDIEIGSYKCGHCDRVYYSDRSLKHHVKLKHTTDEAVDCELCGKICNNKYYLASHIKIVHNNDSWSKCDYCDKQFKSKRNIRRHIEYTHMGMQRYKCIECETLFKEKRSLRKHVRTKHPDSASFPQCQFCYKRFESAKSCKIHLKLLHSFNLNTYPCDLCSVSFTSKESLDAHLETMHLREDEIYKCEECNIVFKGHESFEQHNEMHHIVLTPNVKQKLLPRCILCMKDFSTRKTLKRHIKKFHEVFDSDELATFGSRRRVFTVDCEECLKKFNDEYHYSLYLKLKHLRDSVIFNCDLCNNSYNCIEYSIQRYRLNVDPCKGKMILSDLCTAEMSDEEEFCGFGSLHEMEPESTTVDIKLEMEESDIKTEPMSP